MAARRMAARRMPVRIVVVGAGPVGLLFARLLHERSGRELKLRIIDARAPAPWQSAQTDPRVYALSRESQWLLSKEWPEIAQRRASPYRRMRVFEGESPDGPAAVDFDAAMIGEPDLGHIVEDSLLRTALLGEIERAGIETAFGTGVASLEFRDPGVRLHYGDAAVEDVHLVVGADGADSRVRAAAGIGVRRKDYGQRAIVTHVETSKPHAATAWQRFLPGGPLAFLPLADGRSSVVWTNPTADADRRMQLADDAFLAELQTASAGVLGTLGPCSPRFAFPLELKHASRYTRPGVALIGDAAHAVHPLAGQGVNLGLRDAAVLATVVGAALAAGQYPGDDRVLRRYARTQRAHNLAMQLAFDALNELFGQGRVAWLKPVRGLGMAAVDAFEPAKRLLMRRALGLDAGSAAGGGRFAA